VCRCPYSFESGEHVWDEQRYRVDGSNIIVLQCRVCGAWSTDYVSVKSDDRRSLPTAEQLRHDRFTDTITDRKGRH
jgi:hypothetical protein